MIAPMVVEGAMNGEMFLAYVENCQGDSKLAAEPLDGEVFVVLAAFDRNLGR
jgi:hypothetical protein